MFMFIFTVKQLREALKKTQKSLESFQTFLTTPPPAPIVWKFPKSFLKVIQKYIETNEYILIHPETLDYCK